MGEGRSAEDGRAPVDVLYIACKGRSGGTILGRILGEIEGFAFVGETSLASRALLERRVCGCGVRLEDCATWRAVRESAGGVGDPALDAGLFARGSALRTRHLPLAMLPSGNRWLARRFSRHLAASERLYRAVHTAMAARVVVDSSKPPSYGYLLSLAPGIRFHVVHLVRDPRAVAYSSRRPKRSSIAPGESHAQRGPIYSASTWMLSNLWAELCWRRAPGQRLRLRYEDFIARPRQSIMRIVAMVGSQPMALPLVGERTVVCHAGHSVGGNADRFRTGPIPLVPDDEWRARMRRGERGAVTALTWPLLVRYGYSGMLPRDRPSRSGTREG
jgi:hypothetical protein